MMAWTIEMELLLLLLLLLLVVSPSAASDSEYQCDWCPRHSTASLFPPNNNKDACCEHELVPEGFHVAAASAGFFLGCGACYQLRCRDRKLCGDFVKVFVATTTEKRNGTAGFVLTRDAFAAMGVSSDQLDSGVLHSRPLQVDFRRIPCEYGNKNLAVRVEEEDEQGSLAFRFLYQGGLTDIAAVEVHQGGWRSTARRRSNKQQQGAVVWRTATKSGPLQLRLVVTAGSGGKWLRTELPADWRPGGVYDTGIQVTDVAVTTCTRSCRALDLRQ